MITDPIVAELDDLATAIRTVTGWRVITDPDAVVPPCILVALPTVEDASLAGLIIDVPIDIVAPAPGDRRSLVQMLSVIPDLLDLLGADRARPVVINPDSERQYPGYEITARRLIGRTLQ